MSLKSSLIYFMLGNYFNHREIGNYINESNNISISQNILNEIISTSKKIFDNLDENNKKNKEIFQNYIIYYTLTNTDTFYLAAIKRDFESNIDDEEIYQLFEDIEYQGIKKLTDQNGELSKIGKQNLKFCIEQNNQQNYKKNNSILNFFNMNNDKEQNSKSISLLSTQINEVHNDDKEGKQKLLINTDIGNMDKKKEKIKDSSLNPDITEKILKKRMICRRIAIGFCFLSLIIIVPIIIFKK